MSWPIPSRTPRQALDKLVDKVVHERFLLGRDVRSIIRQCVLDGEEIPEKYKPGYLVRSAKPEELAMLRQLRTEDLQNYRMDSIPIWESE